jgi:hypothetical protein
MERVENGQRGGQKRDQLKGGSIKEVLALISVLCTCILALIKIVFRL